MTENWRETTDETRIPQHGTDPRIEQHPLLDGVRIVDPIEGSQFSLLTPSSVEPTVCDTEAFYFPVDTAASIHTTEIETPYLVDVWVRDMDGEIIGKSANDESVSAPPGEYNVEISTAQVKLYLAIDGGVDVQPRDDRVRISARDTCTMTIGVRSLHEQPAATITTTADPEDVMAAISTFGSALKTTSCERSFPTLRGHPPLLECGSDLEIPDALSPPQTDVRIEVPPALEYVYPVASLAYYVGATVVPGPEPTLVADGEAFSLTAADDFETTVSRVLKQVFLMDCVTRTEGYYTVDLYERELVERHVDLDFETLYDRSLGEQIRTYLSIPYEDVAEAIPRWKLTADVTPVPEHAETLPFLAKDLAVIRCPSCMDIESRSIHSGEASLSDFFGRGSSSSRGGATDQRQAFRSTTEDEPFEENVFRPPPADSIEQTYVGEGIPLGASKMTIEAYHRRLAYTPSENTRTSVAVVCNEDDMNEENVVSEIYGTQDWIDFDITTRQNLTVNEMREVLQTEYDFLHYIGHVDPEGIRCVDGWLDVSDLEFVSVSSFVLNACKSYSQGRELIEKGAISGVVTVSDVLNKTATKLGRTIAHLVDNGFTISSCMDLLEKESIIANQYLAVGDGNTTLIENESGTPNALEIEQATDSTYEVTVHCYPSERGHLGTIYQPNIKAESQRFLNSGEIRSYNLTGPEINDYIRLQKLPIEMDNEIYWSDEFQL